ncbi:hypothetical protein U732_62 [Clostridium argentinense CDC 2741]|uniref:Uncharacterized protein n=3 Tax=Clostridium argentinense TaxID=29341 RepID=A0A0C1UA39_9CLOT|nr:hypothetical protein [Clostridium argentinense]ARC83083.1 hypothetical protein RSJ17_00070 [Clostridium argentinense]KIE44445.1 hypothetical protein U732_62 [Clostridium argentinense CDC 2741]NFP51740.1 hypothetical protein [Clostridium argentinense]NFP74889.1 hypothetical protein [Clostridium argentinense]NFP78319.1 hypothetical protein [Clostridium argentinense]
MRFSQFINTNILIKDIKSYNNDFEGALMRKLSTKEKTKFKSDILTIIKIIFSPTLFNNTEITFVGDNIDLLFSKENYTNYSDKLVINYKDKKYIAPVYILSNCITQLRFAKIMKNINKKIDINEMSLITYDLFEELKIFN